MRVKLGKILEALGHAIGAREWWRQMEGQNGIITDGVASSKGGGASRGSEVSPLENF